MKQFIKYITLIVCACSCWACMDDEIGQEIDYSTPASVKLSIDFSEMQVVTPGTRSAGDAIGKISDLCVLFYKSDETLAMDEANNPIYEYKNSISAEQVTISKKVPAGEYKVVAVANMGNLVTSNTYKETIKTLTGLKSISLQWNNDAIGANNQMFGFFSLSPTNNEIDDAITRDGMSNVAPTSYNAPKLVLSGSKTLYAKLYRTVAKVTVAFNGEGLNSNVFVTIKSIRLGNLPKSCPLWVENKNVTDTLSAKGEGVPQSEVLTDENFGLLRVTNRGAGNESLFPKDAHSQTGPSLFLFENRQGTAPTAGDKDKTRDKKKYGTFIEIEALYANESTGSNGKIIYRYMLGEDTPNKYDNYNLTRNRHYKVTLMLQKSGKEEPYWRVEYTENPSINLPTEVNISYRQSAKLNIPFTVVEAYGGISSVTAQIIENPWYDDLDANGNREATVMTGSTDKQWRWGFLAWTGCQSNNDTYGINKTSAINITQVEGKYQLSIQTESLGFKTDRGDEPADSFTGYNNYSNSRTAKIRVTVTYYSGETRTADVKVVQVPRIVNPIAVYRKWNSQKPFKIRLLNVLGAEIESYGPWKAEVESGADWFGIKNETSSVYGTSCNSGDAGGAIRFDYKPLSTLGSADATPRCGVIVVRFSNYNVEHRIYVRQGDAPMAIGNRESLWTSYNYIGIDANNQPLFTDSPMEEGAWLKSGNSLGILANNTDNTDKFENPPGSFKMSDGTTRPWNTYSPSSDNTVQFNAPGYELPTQDDIHNIQSLREYSGLGIGYDDNATETVVFNEDAQYTNPAMGRRGIAICDTKGRNLFFPTGKRGYGRRRNDMHGGLHYANSTIEPSKINRPALIGLPRSMGGIYWANGSQKLSFNYSLSNIELQSTDNGIGVDACFARLMKGSDLMEFNRYYEIVAATPIYFDYTVSITKWGNITDYTINPMQGFYTVAFKYNIKEVDKAKDGVIITAVQNGITYEKKITIRELEGIPETGKIQLDRKN